MSSHELPSPSLGEEAMGKLIPIVDAAEVLFQIVEEATTGSAILD